MVMVAGPYGTGLPGLKETNRGIRDLFTYSCLAVLFHYFDEPNPAIPKSSLELNVWLISKLKDLAADQFTEDYE
jgi:hypothetical protein